MEIGLAVGGAVLSPALQVLFDKLLKKFPKHKNDGRLLNKLEMTLDGLKIVLSDAENKQASNRHVSNWLNKLRDAVDDADNLMEEVKYEALRLEVEETSNQQVSDAFFVNIKEKLEKTIETLEALQTQIGNLGLMKHFDSGKKETRTPSTSLVDESGIFGRENEKEELIKRLLTEDPNGENVTVVPIVGMGGLGKTTLAKVAYNHEMVKNHFNLKAWFCVSERYDAVRITKGLLQEIGSFDLKDDGNLNQLQVKLKDSLNGKKFLIVLDDYWNVNCNEWDDLRNIFKGVKGSKIIVTTRKERVALMMGTERISMNILSPEDSWSLFKEHAFKNTDSKGHPEHEEVGKQIAEKCKGLPLALKTLAGMLRAKTEIEEWKHILRSEIWEQELQVNGILPALMFSYNDLPAPLKQCFSYCAIFPKDYPFRKEQVIHLWIANGLVPIQDSGNQYFLELRSRSLFERVPNPSQGNTEEFLMHDLVNDLAQIASSKLCVRLEECQGDSHMLNQSRHLSFSMGEGGDLENLRPLNELVKLRTLLPINIRHNYYIGSLSNRVLHNILPTLTSLRALSLSPYSIKELPDALFIKLKLLRFLDLSRTKIKRLPDSICALYNLETLLLSSCDDLEELPPQMEKLINLRHLDISNTSRLKMLSLHLSKLKSLQVLVEAKFLLGGSCGWRMEDLGKLHNLYGSLSILELQNVVNKGEAQKANMREKKHVEKLSLKWSESIADNSKIESGILDALLQHTNIKELEISGYRGTEFPKCLADHSFLEVLAQLSLSNCKDCFSLPALGQLPSLKFLSIGRMDRIRKVTEEFYGSSSSKRPFNSLEKLEFAEMPEWEQWHVPGNEEFPTLQNLSIDDCPKLVGKLPENLCSLTRLTISRCPEFSLETPIQLSSLKKFKVVRSPKVGVVFDEAELFTSQLEGMKQIDELHIGDYNSLISLSISTLKRIQIRGCHNHTRFSIPTWTERLEIWSCGNLEILLSAACGTQMTSLSISSCEKLKRLPERMQELLPSLKELKLCNCPELESFPEGGLPFNLEDLWIFHCEKLVNSRKDWRLQRLPCLRELRIDHDGSDEEIPWELPCSIRRLITSNLKTLSSQILKSLTSLEYLCMCDLPQILSLLEQGLPSSLSELCIKDDVELQSLPTEGLGHLTSLRRLIISSCHQLQSLAETALPSSLSKLTIEFCHNLQSLPVKGMPSSLSKLTILDCPNLSLAETALPSSLSELTIESCRNLQSLPVKGMPSSLSNLTIGDCPNLQSLAETALPSSLSELTIMDCRNLQSLPVKGMPSSLSELTITNCPNLQSLAETALPSSLSVLTIMDCPNLQSLPVKGMPSSLSVLTITKCHQLQSLAETALPSSLSELTIESCHNLQSLPVKGGMPPSLSGLYIHDCPLLKPLLEFDKGEYWSKIAKISYILIDGEWL